MIDNRRLLFCFLTLIDKRTELQQIKASAIKEVQTVIRLDLKFTHVVLTQYDFQYEVNLHNA